MRRSILTRRAVHQLGSDGATWYKQHQQTGVAGGAGVANSRRRRDVDYNSITFDDEDFSFSSGDSSGDYDVEQEVSGVRPTAPEDYSPQTDTFGNFTLMLILELLMALRRAW